MLAGDFNCCYLDNDRQPPTHLKDKSRNNFNDLIKNNNLLDIQQQYGSKINLLSMENNARQKVDWTIYLQVQINTPKLIVK